MLGTIRNRLILVAVLVAASVFYLLPREVTVRERGPDGVMRDVRHKRIPLKLGLDLQGGMHLALELDQSQKVSANPSEDIQRAVQVLRKRTDEFGVQEPVIQQVGEDRIVVELAGVSDPARAKGIVQKSAFLEFRITDETGGLEKALPAMDRVLRQLGVSAPAGAAARPSAVEQLLGGDTTRTADTTKAAPGDTAKAAADTAAPAEAGGGPLSALIQSGGAAGDGGIPGEYVVLESAYARVDSMLHLPEVRALWPRGVEFFWAGQATSVGVSQYRYLYALQNRAIITGERLVDATAQLDPLTNSPIVVFELDRAGGRQFGNETGRHVGDFMAILLDQRVQGRPPVIQSRIERRGQITLGNRSLQEAQDLALTLRAGALPVPLRIVEERQIGASLGEDSIRGGVLAGIVGTAFVVLIMLGYYAVSGAVAVVALTFYLLFTIGGLSMFSATLTLPGLAGLVLSIGIAVDANVLIFERIREELARGKTVRLAVDEGFRHAMPAIIDSNLTTVLTALFLFQFGTGPVQGFAVTLVVGIFASMITAVFLTRTVFLIWLQRRPDMKTLSVGKFRFFTKAAYDFIGNRRYAYGLTALILAVGLVALLLRGVNYSVEFTGGTLLQVTTAPGVSAAQIRNGLRSQGVTGSEIQGFGAPGEFVIRTRVAGQTGDADDTQAARAAVTSALDRVLGQGSYRIERAEVVGPKVGGELRQRAFLAILLSFIAVLAYLAYRFEWRFGLAAILATAHDIMATICFIAVLDLEVSLVVVAAMLTVVGYSLNDTIVIFDRVRENLRKTHRKDFISILNTAVNETLPRTVFTGGTALATLVAIAVFGGEVIRPFALVMFFGIFTGTFSSIFIAAPALLWIESKWPGAQAHGLRPAPTPGPAPARKKAQPVA
ncbi:MAG: protein translocase subunit SecD [Gemmatimonadales bacterium]